MHSRREHLMLASCCCDFDPCLPFVIVVLWLWMLVMASNRCAGCVPVSILNFNALYMAISCSVAVQLDGNKRHALHCQQPWLLV
jgi:hypothetical protein